MNEHFSAQPQNSEAIQALNEKLENLIGLVPEEMKRYRSTENIKKDLMPRATISAGDAAGIKGPGIVKILEHYGMRVQYGSLKVFLTHARNAARALGITENQAQAGIQAFLQERVGAEAAQAMMAVGQELIDMAPKELHRASISGLRAPNKRAEKPQNPAEQIVAPVHTQERSAEDAVDNFETPIVPHADNDNSPTQENPFAQLKADNENDDQEPGIQRAA